jgi:large subunit ribosomal protein L4
MAKLPVKKSSCLIALPSMDEKILLAARNLPGVKTVQAKDLNILDLLNSKFLVIPKESLKVIKETFLKEA